jgi:hypothetical protein
MATCFFKIKEQSTINLPALNSKLYISNKMVTTKTTISKRIAFHSMKVQETYVYNNKIMDQIWWLVHGKAIMEFSVKKRTIIQKLIHRRLPCHQREHLFYAYKPPFCRHCTEIEESHNHIIQCLNCPKRKILKKSYILTLESYFKHTGADETTSRVLTKYISAEILQQGAPVVLSEIAPDASRRLQQPVIYQEKIGWDQF